MPRVFDCKDVRKSARFFNITYNNYTDETLAELRVAMLTQQIPVWSIGIEGGEPQNGTRDPAVLALQGADMEVQGVASTPHLQVALGIKNERVMRAIMSSFPQGGHWEVKHPDSTPRSCIGYPLKGRSPKFHKKAKGGKCPRGSPAQAEEEWCWTEAGPHTGHQWEGFYSGEFPIGQGKSADHDQIIKDIMSGDTNYDEILLGPGGLDTCRQYGRVLEQVQDLRNQSQFRTEECEGEWYYGDTGVGKTHKALQGWDPKTHYMVPSWAQKSGGFWCGYKGQPIVVLNEFKGDMPFGELMELCDKWPKNVNIKGRAGVPFMAKKFIITSAVSPEETYHKLKLSMQQNQDGSFDQLYRRFKVYELVGRREPPAKKQRIQLNVETGEETDIEPIDVVDHNALL
ncbi:MAG TPA: hypothetical protein EYN66_11865 [Myxococcales bacterium]|nr:hypothetical protein [Myxococcales bacterium]